MVKMKLTRRPCPMDVIHAQMAFLCYTNAREKGQTDIMELNLQIIHDLGFEVEDQPNGGWALVSRKETE